MSDALSDALGRSLGSAPSHFRRVGGGDINRAAVVELDDGRRIFVKTNPDADRAMFPAEAKGLSWLAEAGALRVPKVVAVSELVGDGPCFLALELLESAPRVRDFDERLGRGLAALHRCAPDAFGLDHDNYIGSLPQTNAPETDWPSFYRARRLEPMLRRATDDGHASPTMRRGFERLFAALADRVGPAEPPARLHGDLWGGNLHVDEAGLPCLIDPAVYGGHREMDLAMMALFGGFSARVFAAYDEAFPLAQEWRDRVPLYQLYPLLVHVCLFGGGYVGSVERALAQVG